MSEQTSPDLTSPSQRTAPKRYRCRLPLGNCPKQVYEDGDLFIWCRAGGIISGKLLRDFGFLMCMYWDDAPDHDRAGSPS